MQRIVGEAAHRELGGVRETDDDRAGLLEIGRHGGVARRNVVLEGDNAVGVCLPLNVDVDLDCHRHPVKLAECYAARLRLVGRTGGGDRLLAEIDDDGVECGFTACIRSTWARTTSSEVTRPLP